VKEYITNYYKDFISTIISTLREENISVENGKPEIQLFTALPDNLNIFEEDFIENRENVYTFKNPEKFKRRIMGLTSYFRSAQEELLPRYDKQNNLHILSIPMSDYQFKLYEEERKLERVIEAKQKSSKKAAPVARAAAGGPNNTNDIFKDPTSTFKIYSRMWCNFVMPAEFKRPKPDDLNIPDEDEDEEPIQENAVDTRIAAELEGDEIMLKEIEDTVTWMYHNLQQTYWPPLCGKGFFDYEIKKMERVYLVCKDSLKDPTKHAEIAACRKNFVAFVDEHDRRRGTNFLKTFPEFKEYYHQWKQL
jgi:hypothetical protein